jgi:hypothetical protein
MKLTNRILLMTAIVFIGILILSPLEAQAQLQKISPGTYVGHFRHSAHAMMVDVQIAGKSSSHFSWVQNTYVEGTLIIEVDKNGKILSGIKFLTNSVPTYYIDTKCIIPSSCCVTGYLEGETKIDLKQNSAGTFDPNAPVFSANFTFNNVNPLSYSNSGVDTDCPGFASQSYLIEGRNAQIDALNKYKVMEFVVVGVSNDHFSGYVVIPGWDRTVPTPGGYAEWEDKDSLFNVHKIDILAPLTDDDLAPLVGDWRSK